MTSKPKFMWGSAMRRGGDESFLEEVSCADAQKCKGTCWLHCLRAVRCEGEGKLVVNWPEKQTKGRPQGSWGTELRGCCGSCWWLPAGKEGTFSSFNIWMNPPMHADSDCRNLGWSLRFCPSHKLPGDAQGVVHRPHLREKAWPALSDLVSPERMWL